MVVVLDDWTVLCYNNKLKLLWTQQPIKIPNFKDFVVKAMSVLITPHSADNIKQDVKTKRMKGSVIVGASFNHREHHKRK